MNNKLKFLHDGLDFYDEQTKNLIKIKITNQYFTLTINSKGYYFTLNDEGKCIFDGLDYSCLPDEVTAYPTLNDLRKCNKDNVNKNNDEEIQLFNDLVNNVISKNNESTKT